MCIIQVWGNELTQNRLVPMRWNLRFPLPFLPLAAATLCLASSDSIIPSKQNPCKNAPIVVIKYQFMKKSVLRFASSGSSAPTTGYRRSLKGKESAIFRWTTECDPNIVCLQHSISRRIVKEISTKLCRAHKWIGKTLENGQSKSKVYLNFFFHVSMTMPAAVTVHSKLIYGRKLSYFAWPSHWLAVTQKRTHIHIPFHIAYHPIEEQTMFANTRAHIYRQYPRW